MRVQMFKGSSSSMLDSPTDLIIPGKPVLAQDAPACASWRSVHHTPVVQYFLNLRNRVLLLILKQPHVKSLQGENSVALVDT